MARWKPSGRAGTGGEHARGDSPGVEIVSWFKRSGLIPTRSITLVALALIIALAGNAWCVSACVAESCKPRKSCHQERTPKVECVHGPYLVEERAVVAADLLLVDVPQWDAPVESLVFAFTPEQDPTPPPRGPSPPAILRV